MTYQYLFGSVPLRRLGISLGVDLVSHKICTLNCVYCEYGASTELTLDRSGVLPELMAVSFNRLNQIKNLWTFSNIEIIAPVSERQIKKSFRKDVNEDAIVLKIAGTRS
ncbi:MAG: hypothetical protein KAH15_04080 [Candidatus Marinimicrobia bacterium]|nr:hypothetical protein [Candidatus Neomarinimicrobiota bacterium]